MPNYITMGHLKGGAPAALLLTGMMLAGTGFFLVALFCLLDAAIARPVWDDWRLDLSGQVAKAKPLSVKRQGTGHVDGNTTVSHTIRVQYEDDDGDEHKAEFMSADRDVISRAAAKKSLRIEYHPDDPGLVRLLGGRSGIFGNYILIPLLAGFLGVVMFVMGVRLRRKTRRATSPPPGGFPMRHPGAW